MICATIDASFTLRQWTLRTSPVAVPRCQPFRRQQLPHNLVRHGPSMLLHRRHDVHQLLSVFNAATEPRQYGVIHLAIFYNDFLTESQVIRTLEFSQAHHHLGAESSPEEQGPAGSAGPYGLNAQTVVGLLV